MSYHLEGAARILLKPTVFLNPAQVFNRDLSILVCSNYTRATARPVKILEAMAASGVRSIRYYKELGVPVHVLANDLSTEAVEEIRANFEANEVPGDVRQQDACQLMYSEKDWDVVDVDPYGSAAGFLDAAVQCVRDGGLLCITSTDMATLCGNNPDTCYYKYNSVPSTSKYCHEFALRMLLHSLTVTANKYQKCVSPLLSISVDFYVRVFVKVFSSAKTAKLSILNTALVLQCASCPAFYFQSMGRTGKNRPIPTLFTAPNTCTECAGGLTLQGPIYTGPLHNKDFITELLGNIEPFEFQTHEKVKGVLISLANELDNPLSWDISQLCKFLKSSMPSQKQFRSAFKSLGLQISQVHTKPNLYKTDATPRQMFDIIKSWVSLM